MNLASQLSNLEEAQLVRQIDRDLMAYIFKHVLVQESAYESLLKQERKRLHLAVGLALESATAATEEPAIELARHFGIAGQVEKAARYALCAGDAAARVFAFPEAQTHYAYALEALSRLPDTRERRRERVDATVKLVAVALRAQGPEWSLEKLRAAEELLAGSETDAQDRERLARVHFWMGDAYSHLNQQRQAIAYLEQALEAAREGVTDETLLAIPSNVIGRALAAQGRFGQAEPLLAQAAPLLEKSANWYEWILAVGFLGFVRAARGDPEAGLERTARAFARAQELGTLTGTADSHIFTSFIYMQKGAPEESLAHANDALRAAHELKDQLLIFLAHNVRAWSYTRLGQFQEAEMNFAQAREIASQMGGQLFFADLFLAAYAELALRQGRMEEAAARAEEAVEVARQVGSVFSEGLAQRVWGQALAVPDPAQAALHYQESIRLFEQGDARIEAQRTREVWNQ
jgi:tetratricopeptide (TPR) repeat protein